MLLEVKYHDIYNCQMTFKEYIGTSLVAQWLRIHLPRGQTFNNLVEDLRSHMLQGS